MVIAVSDTLHHAVVVLKKKRKTEADTDTRFVNVIRICRRCLQLVTFYNNVEKKCLGNHLRIFVGSVFANMDCFPHVLFRFLVVKLRKTVYSCFFLQSSISCL